MTRWPVLALLALTHLHCAMADIVARNGAIITRPPDKIPNKITDPRRPEAALAVLWVGHATALIQIADKYILTDPVFTEFVGSVSHRLVEPGIDITNLPPLDLVLISHRHYDHLSPATLEQLDGKIATILVPENTVADIPAGHFAVRELPYWQTWQQNGLTVTAVPVKHVGARTGLDGGSHPRSFTGYVIEYQGITVYFPGDTTYDRPDFVAVAERFPHIDLALMPICPISPRDFMKKTHVDPGEALQAVIDLKARVMIPIHYDTFINSLDDPGDCLRALTKAVRDHGFPATPVVLPLRIGEQRVLLSAAAGR